MTDSSTATAPTLDREESLLFGLRTAVSRGDRERARDLARRMVEEDALQLLEDLQPAELTRLFAILGDESLGGLLAQLDAYDAARILSRMSVAQAADILEEIDPDDATDILEEVDPKLAEGLLVEMEPAEAAEIRDLMSYPPDSAGGIMTPAFVAVSPNLRADEAVAALRRVAEEAETVNYVYVCDDDLHLLGVLSLHNLVLTRTSTPVRDVMIHHPFSIPVLADREDAARRMTEHDLLALPVVDVDNRLIGIITADDVADVLVEEATEDIARLGASSPLDVPYLRATPYMLFRKRITWLLMLFVAQFASVLVLERYESRIEAVPTLAVFMTILIGTGGNIGSQTVTTVIRAMAIGEVAQRHVFRVVGKELVTGAALGLAMAVLMFGRGYWVAHDTVGAVALGLTLGLTVFGLAVWAAVIAAALPIILDRLKIDPAVVSAPLITSLIDATGLILYFSIAGALIL